MISVNASGMHSRGHSSSDGGDDNSVIIRRVGDDEDTVNDVSIVNLNQSVDMMSVSGKSMASVSDTSAGGVVKVSSRVSDGGSMYSASDVQVADVQILNRGNTTYDDMNNSMAGLSDMSMGDINVRGGNDSMADLSMASLGGNDSMAGIEDNSYRHHSKSNNQFKSGTTQEDSDNNAGQENMLDGLKIELGLVSNPQGTDASFIKQKEDVYRASVVFDEEDEENDSDEADDKGRSRKKSFKRKRPSDLTSKISPKPKLKNLLGHLGPSESPNSSLRQSPN